MSDPRCECEDLKHCRKEWAKCMTELEKLREKCALLEAEINIYRTVILKLKEQEADDEQANH